MRDPEQQRLALECLKLAFEPNCFRTEEAIEAARKFYAFVSGADADAAQDAAFRVDFRNADTGEVKSFDVPGIVVR